MDEKFREQVNIMMWIWKAIDPVTKKAALQEVERRFLYITKEIHSRREYISRRLDLAIKDFNDVDDGLPCESSMHSTNE